MGTDQPCCAFCGDVVGVYEPAYLLLSDGTTCRGSRLTFGDALKESASIVMHESCSGAFLGREGGSHRPQS